MSKVPTPHNAANADQIAKVVLMPGDPLRSKWIAETFFENPELVNNIRGMQCYTGTWHGNKVTVMASGIGIASFSVFAYELFNFYDVDAIIRVGTIGSIQKDVNVGDVIIAEKAYTTSNFLKFIGFSNNYVPKGDKELLKKAVKAADEIEKNCKVHTGSVLTSDIYYGQDSQVEKWQAKGILGFEMETASLYAHAKQAGKKGLGIFTVSNSILEGTEMDPKLRERALREMVEIALKAAFE